MLGDATSESRTNMRHLRHLVAFATVAAWLTSGCTHAADKTTKETPSNADVAIPVQGGYPSNFPANVPKPALALETAAETFTLRLTSSNAFADLAAYKNVLVTACYTISNETNDLTGPSKQATFLATKDAVSIVANVFAPDSPRRNFMDVVVNPVVRVVPNSFSGATTHKAPPGQQQCAT
jgi:hypothetical protein